MIITRGTQPDQAHTGTHAQNPANDPPSLMSVNKINAPKPQIYAMLRGVNLSILRTQTRSAKARHQAHKACGKSPENTQLHATTKDTHPLSSASFGTQDVVLLRSIPIPTALSQQTRHHPFYLEAPTRPVTRYATRCPPGRSRAKQTKKIFGIRLRHLFGELPATTANKI